jgi:hypothetical protein
MKLRGKKVTVRRKWGLKRITKRVETFGITFQGLLELVAAKGGETVGDTHQSRTPRAD